ncbi:MAG: zinc-binding alcohol dehydrogenase [Clostridiales bacterium]|jgi:threonine dehydrogenase-like Zn-dependent dehydrogenase|nr:zinc-binding alcohol dehydrogenase [Clostridiales bacterium]
MPKQLVANNPGVCEIEEYEVPELKSGEVKAKTLYGCPKHGTEMQFFFNKSSIDTHDYDLDKLMFVKSEDSQGKPFMKYPGVNGKYYPGNMWVGEIIETAGDVKDFKAGQRVAAHGKLREIQVVQADALHAMPDDMDWKSAVCLDPITVSYGGVQDSRLKLGDVAAVFGLGAIGLLNVQLAKLAGASKVIGLDVIESRRSAATQLGADFTINPAEVDAGEELRKLTNYKGVDVAFETSGSYSALHHAIRGICPAGTVCSLAWHQGSPIGLDLGKEAHYNFPNLIFSFPGYGWSRFPNWDRQRLQQSCWNLLRSGRINCDPIVNPVVDFMDSAQMYMAIASDPSSSIKLGVKF